MACAQMSFGVEKPPAVADDPERYREVSLNFAESVRSTTGPWVGYEDEVSPGFVRISRDLARRTEHAHRIFEKGLQALIASYLNNPRLQDLIPVPEKIVRIMCESGEFDEPVHGCFLRPDVVWTLSEGRVVPKIIEVNVRFPTHCFVDAAAVGSIPDWQRWHGQSVAWPSEYREIIPTFERASPEGSSIWVIKGREVCGDCEAFGHVMRERGRETRVVHPGTLAVDAFGALHIRGDARRDTPHLLLLELFQDELLSIPMDVLRAVGRTPRVNPFRGTFIAHSKAIMAAIWDETVGAVAFAGWPPDEVQALRRVVPETFVPGSLPRGAADFIGAKDEWVLKPSAAGRGFGVTLGRETEPDAWGRLFARATEECDWVVQRYHPSVPVYAFDHRAMMRDATRILLREFPMVGTTFGGPQGQFLGLGPVRYDDAAVVNTTSGGVLTFPVIEKA